DLIFINPRFDAYKAISPQIRVIFAEYTPIIEPLSLVEIRLTPPRSRACSPSCSRGSTSPGIYSSYDPGMKLRADGGFSCLRPGEIVVVQADRRGPPLCLVR